jgi:hypothetical protein
MNREDFDPEERKEAHEELKEGYSEVLKVTDDDLLLVTSMFKIDKVNAEINRVQFDFDSGELSSYQALMELEVLLGAMNALRIDIKNSVFPKDEI